MPVEVCRFGGTVEIVGPLALAGAIALLLVVAFIVARRRWHRPVKSAAVRLPSIAGEPPLPSAIEPVRIFISYAHEDETLRAELGAQLKRTSGLALLEVLIRTVPWSPLATQPPVTGRTAQTILFCPSDQRGNDSELLPVFRSQASTWP